MTEKKIKKTEQVVRHEYVSIRQESELKITLNRGRGEVTAGRSSIQTWIEKESLPQLKK